MAENMARVTCCNNPAMFNAWTDSQFLVKAAYGTAMSADNTPTLTTSRRIVAFIRMRMPQESVVSWLCSWNVKRERPASSDGWHNTFFMKEIFSLLQLYSK